MTGLSVIAHRKNGQLGAATGRPQAGQPVEFGLKRGLDLVVVVLAAAMVLPLIGLAALAIQLVDRGPVFYAQERRGLGGRRIRVWKLRPMYCDAAARLERHLAGNPAARAEWNRFFKLRNDPRVLPWIGGLLRCSSIDELPQVWNLLVGEPTNSTNSMKFDASGLRVEPKSPGSA